MTIKEFIEKAIEGNAGLFNYPERIKINKDGKTVTFKYQDHEWDGKTKWSKQKSIHEITMNPKAWEAVGKVEGWGEDVDCCYIEPGHTLKMHQMIDHLVEGGDIESYLSEL